MTEEELMLTHILKCDRSELVSCQIELNDHDKKLLEDFKERRRNHEPLQYILGECEFFDCRLKVNQNVLIPRPETEIMVEMALAKSNDLIMSKKWLKILDLGTGSGNIAIAMAKHIDRCDIVSIDISTEAIKTARENAKLNDVNKKIIFECIDLRDFIEREIRNKNKYDIIISNPPYIDSTDLKHLQEEVKKEPKIALDGGYAGLKYCRDIIQKSEEILANQAMLFMEIGDHQAEDIQFLFDQSCYRTMLSFEKDYRQYDRIVILETV